MISLIGALVVLVLLWLVAGANAGECEPRSSCFGLESTGVTLSTHQAGAHPDVTISFALKQDPNSPVNPAKAHESYAPARDVRIETPPGLVGNPNVLGVSSQCTLQELVNWGPASGCPNSSQVGTTKILLYGYSGYIIEPLYMMTPPGGDVVARLGFIAGNVPALIDIKVRSQSDYGLTAEVVDASPLAGFITVDTTLWGVPAAKAHDSERMTAFEAVEELFKGGGGISPPRPPGSRPLAFMTNPTRCGTPLSVGFSLDSWFEPGRFVGEQAPFPGIFGCDRLPFNPSVFAEPTSHVAAGSSGLEVTIRMPAPEGVEALESSQLKDIRVDLPAGVSVNPGAADGLLTCSASDVGFGTQEPSKCSDGAKLAEAEFDIPALPRRMKGAIYLREPQPGHLFRIWIVADDQGAHVKLPGELEIDEKTGQIHTVVMDSPQVPVREVRIVFKAGFRAPLANPDKCGEYLTHYELVPWSGTPPVSGTTPMKITEGCDTGGFAPSFTAGTVGSDAGGFAPFLFDLGREDGEQEPVSLDVSLPAGLTAKLAGVPLCEGEDAVTGKCSAASQIGRVLVATGAGPAPLWVPQARKRSTAAYLGGPYEGAPFSLIAVVPAQAGPYDLGTVVVRSAIYVDPATTQVTVKSDPLPQIIQGIPLPYRHIRVAVERPDFILKPTSCEPTTIAADVHSNQGTTAHVSAPFQVSNCQKLAFKPSFKVFTSARTSRANGASLTVKLSYPTTPQGTQANIKSVKVELPKQLPSRLTTLQQACSSAQFQTDPAGCPSASIVGHAIARTPILPVPLAGPAYFVSHGGAKFPELILVLQGYGITFQLHGETFINKAGITSSTFAAVPDQPVSSFELTLPEGRFSALAANGDLCQSGLTMPTLFKAQNGRTLRQATPITVTGCKPSIVVLRHSLKAGRLTLLAQVPSAGRLEAGGEGLTHAVQQVRKAGPVTLTLALSARERRILAQHPGRRLNAHVRLVLTPKHGHTITSSVTVLMG